jgi:protein phosphatase 2C family protein 2/3
MGCGGSKNVDNQFSAAPSSNQAIPSASLLDAEEVKNQRMSVRYQVKEVGPGRNTASRRSSAKFDKARIGTHTKHGMQPGPRGIGAAKINQDRGIVCWPFCGSLNEALLCVFDGHGPKGEKASEFCMKTLPELLEKDHEMLSKDPAGCLSKNIIKLDEMLLGGELGAMAMSCGTTSNVLYMRGEDLWVACSGDSRAIMASRKKGKLIATDLSEDHKPDLPEERARIEAAGGVVTPAGANGSPSRVWANGGVGLAMSRSIGDGKCKMCGVIPDPEIKQFKMNPAKEPKDDGDLFVIVASDGVWEFLPSLDAATIVDGEDHAGTATERLCSVAADCWRREEGNYRDDITCIITYLPFLEDWGDEAHEPDDEEEEGKAILINKGAKGFAKMKPSEAISPGNPAAAVGVAEKAEEESGAFAKRRLSMANPYGDEDNDWGDDFEEEDD